MTDIHTTPLFISAQERKQLRQRLLNITETLLTALEIDPYGRQLIMACGTGNEVCNRDALYCWLQNGVCCEARLNLIAPEQLVHALRRHLEHCIGTWCD